MRKSNNVFLNVVLLLLPFFVLIGFSSWVITSKTEKEVGNEIVNNTTENEMVDVNVHYKQVSNGVTTKTEYYVPSACTVTHNITRYNKSGNVEKSILSAPSRDGKTGKLTNADERIVYYDVNNDVYTKIDERNNSKGPEVIKSLNFNVTSWTKKESSSEYAAVWNTEITETINGKTTTTALRFQCDSGNTVSGHGQKYKVGDVYKAEEELSNDTVINGNVTTTTIVYQRITVYKVEKIVYGNVEVSCVPVDYANWVYYPRYELRKVVITTTKGASSTGDYSSSVKVKKGSIIRAVDLNIADYTQYGYYSNEDYSSLFDFTQPINTTTDIYLRYVKSSNGLSSQVNSNTSTLNVHDQYRSGSGDGYNLMKDLSYDDVTNTAYLDACTVASGSTLNLTYEHEQIYLTPISGNISDNLGNHRISDDNSLAPDYQGSSYIGEETASMHLFLNGDMTVNGTLNVGGKIGGSSASSLYYSYIIGRYAILDLHGHTITVDGGAVNNYGLIKDSIGGGQIIVKNGGKVKSVLTVSDGRGRDQTALGFTKRQTPFTEYRLSYLQVPVTLYTGTSLIGYLKADFQGFGVSNFDIPIVGPTFNSALFSWNSSDSKDYVYYKPYQIKQLSTPSTNATYLYMYNWRNQFEFHSSVKQASSYILSTTFTVSSMSINVSIDFARIDFPISPFFDLVIENGYDLELNSKTTFYPGSSLLVDSGASVTFKNNGAKTYSDISKTAFGFGITLKGESRYSAGGIMAHGSNITSTASVGISGNRFGIGVYNQSTYWNYVQPANININGSISFDTSIDTSNEEGFYYLSGPINLSESAITSIKNNAAYIKTYDIKAELCNGFLYNNTYQDVETQYEFATSFNCLPLISSDTAYLIDSTHNLTGAFDTDSGVFTATDGTNYYLYVDQNLYVGGNTSSYQGNKINKAVTIKKIKKVYSTYNIISDADTSSFYVYYCGIHVPVSSGFSDGTSLSNNSKIYVDLNKFISNVDAHYSQGIRIYTTDESKNTPSSYDCVTQPTVTLSTGDSSGNNKTWLINNSNSGISGSTGDSTPALTIGEDGYWYLNNNKTNLISYLNFEIGRNYSNSVIRINTSKKQWSFYEFKDFKKAKDNDTDTWYSY